MHYSFLGAILVIEAGVRSQYDHGGLLPRITVLVKRAY